MTLADFNRDYLPIAQAAITLFGLISVILLWWQVVLTRKWNKVDAAFRSMDIDKFAQIEADAIAAGRTLGLLITNELTPAEAKALRADSAVLLKVKSLVIFLDKQAVGYLAGYFDDDVFSNTFGPLIRGYAKNLAHYIEVTRVDTGNRETYVDLEQAAEKLTNAYNERQRKLGGNGIGKKL